MLAPYIVTNMFYIIISIFHFAEAIKKLLRKEFYGQKLLQKTDKKKLEVKCFHWACDLQGFNYRLQIQKYCCSTMFENMACVIFILGSIVSSVQGNTLKYQTKATLLLLFFGKGILHTFVFFCILFISTWKFAEMMENYLHLASKQSK